MLTGSLAGTPKASELPADVPKAEVLATRTEHNRIVRQFWELGLLVVVPDADVPSDVELRCAVGSLEFE